MTYSFPLHKDCEAIRSAATMYRVRVRLTIGYYQTNIYSSEYWEEANAVEWANIFKKKMDKFPDIKTEFDVQFQYDGGWRTISWL